MGSDVGDEAGRIRSEAPGTIRSCRGSARFTGSSSRCTSAIIRRRTSTRSYGGDIALIVIATGDVYAGSLPPRALRLVREWVEERRAELEVDCQRAQAHEPLEWISPLS